MYSKNYLTSLIIRDHRSFFHQNLLEKNKPFSLDIMLRKKALDFSNFHLLTKQEPWATAGTSKLLSFLLLLLDV
jgi:hypothetical protein